MKKIFIIIPIIFLLLTITSCNNNKVINPQQYNYIYIISENKFIEIKEYYIHDYGTITIKTKDNKSLLICQANWILTQEESI